MDISPSRPRALRIIAALLGFLLLAGIAVLTGPAPRASAMEIDCSYSTGLSFYVGAGRDGITCTAGSAGTRAAASSSSSPGRATFSGPSSLGTGTCDYYPPGLPDSFGPGWLYKEVDLGNVFGPDGDVWSVQEYLDPATGRLMGRYLKAVEGKGFSRATFVNFTFYRQDPNSSLVIVQNWSCDQDNWDRPDFRSSRLWGTDFAGMPPVPTPPTGLGISGTSALGPLPGKPNQFLYRLDVKNDNTIASPVTIDLDLSQFSRVDDIVLPHDWSCTVESEIAEVCQIANLGSGQTETLVLAVQARPTSASQAAIGAVFAGKFGHRTVGHWANDLDVLTGTRAEADANPTP